MDGTLILWTREKQDGICPECGEPTVLISATQWQVDKESAEEATGYGFYSADVDTVLGRYCVECDMLTKLMLDEAELDESELAVARAVKAKDCVRIARAAGVELAEEPTKE